MSNTDLDQYYRFKKYVAKTILSDKICVDLISNSNYQGTLPAEELLEQQYEDGTYNSGLVHLYDYIPDAETTADTHICIEVEDMGVSTVAVGDYRIEVNIIVPVALMNMYGNIRRDAIAERIDYLLNGSKDIGFGRFERISGTLGIPSIKFRSRKIKYKVKDYNMSGSKLNPT